MNHIDCILCHLSKGLPDLHRNPIHDLINSRVRRVRKGQIVFQQDFPNRELFYIIEGVVKIYSLSESGSSGAAPDSACFN